jgi:hypothetical protein
VNNNKNISCPSTPSTSSSLSSPVNAFNEHQFNSIENTERQLAPQSDSSTSSTSTTATSTDKYMQDTYLNNNYNLYQVINPLDINRNYQQQQQQQQQSQQGFTCNQQNVLRLPTTKKINSYAPQVAKRSKFSHINNISNDTQLSSAENSSSSITNSINNTISSLIKQETCLSFNSDGEASMVSSENDSNSNCSSSLNNDDFSSSSSSLSSTNYQNQAQQLQPQLHPTKLTHININSINSKKVIIATKLEPYCNLNQTFQLQSNCNGNNATNNQINLIKITNGDATVSNVNENNNSFLSNNNSNTNKKADNLNQNNKKIIQYKQLLNSNGNLLKTTQLTKHKQSNNNTNSNCTNNANTINSDGVVINHNGVPLATRPDGKVRN